MQFFDKRECRTLQMSLEWTVFEVWRWSNGIKFAKLLISKHVHKNSTKHIQWLYRSTASLKCCVIYSQQSLWCNVWWSQFTSIVQQCSNWHEYIGWHDRSWTISISKLSLLLTVTSNNFISPCRYIQWNCSYKIS